MAGRTCELRESNPLPRASTLEAGAGQAAADADKAVLARRVWFGWQAVAEGGVAFAPAFGKAEARARPGEVELHLDGTGFRIRRGTEHGDRAPQGSVVLRPVVRDEGETATEDSRKSGHALKGGGRASCNPLKRLGAKPTDAAKLDLSGEASGRRTRDAKSREAGGRVDKSEWHAERTVARTVYAGSGTRRFVEAMPERVLGASARRGDRVTFWDVAEGRHLATVAVRDGCGIAPGTRPGAFLASSGQGGVLAIDRPSGRARPLAAGFLEAGRWDNHLVPAEA